MVEEEHTGEAGEHKEHRFAAVGGCLVEVFAKKLTAKPTERIAAGSAEGVGDEVVNVAGAIGEQLRAFDEQGKKRTGGDGERKSSTTAIEKRQKKAEGNGHKNVEKKVAVDIAQGHEVEATAENTWLVRLQKNGDKVSQTVDAEVAENV